MTPTLFASNAALDHAFANGLAAMLERHHGLGVQILVLANAAYDPALWQRLRAPLALRHGELAERVAAALRRGDALTEPEDDLLVFLKLMAIGFDQVETVRRRRAGPWRLSFNPVRALRPPRMSGARVDGIARPFDPSGFHFNKPFLTKEVLWQGALADKDARLLYNKFPFARLHGLLVPEPERQLPQWLTPEWFSWAWEVSDRLGQSLPGFALAYNSYGAHASVNHLHFQSFIQEEPLPLWDPVFRHNGGELEYPLPCAVFQEPRDAWFYLDALHAEAAPYNLILHAGRLHVLARVPQGSRSQAPWNTGFAWSELAGAITLFGREPFENLTEEDIQQELAKHMAQPPANLSP